VVKQLARIVHVAAVVSGSRHAHADGGTASLPVGRREAQVQVHDSLKAALVIRVARAHATPRCCTYTGLPAAPHRTHHPRRQTYEHLPPSLTLLLLPSHQSLHQTFTLNPSRKHSPPHAHYPPIHPSSSSVPACPCPTHRPVTRPPPDSPRPRYPYNPSRASAPSVNHLPSLSVA